MTIKQAVAHAKEVSEEQRERIIFELEDGREVYNPECEECAKEHEQLADWLILLDNIISVAKDHNRLRSARCLEIEDLINEAEQRGLLL